jgi:predicted ATPase
LSAPSVLDLYYDLVASGSLERDEAQEEALEQLASLANRLHDYKLPGKANPLKRIFGAKRPLYLGRGRSRQDHDHGSFL